MNYPLSQTQMGIYVTCMNTQKEGNYNIDVLYTLDDQVCIDTLCQALEQVVANHPYVKSRLVTDGNGEVVFEDHSQDEFHASVFEIDDIEDVRDHLGAEYDLMKDPLFRLEVYKTKKGNYLYVDFHHVIFDGMSFATFRKELSAAYLGETLLPEGKDGFTVALEEQDLRKTEAYAEAKAWHEQEFGIATEVESTPRPDVYDVEQGEWIFSCHPLKTKEAELKTLCEKHGVGISVPLTAAFGYTLANFSADEEAFYTTVFHGRNDKQTRNAYTMMVKTLAVYHDFRKTPTVPELLQQTSTQMSGTRKHTVYSFGELCHDLGIAPRVCFAYQGAFHDFNISLDGREQQVEDLIQHAPGFDIILHVMQKDDGFLCKVEHNTAMYSPEFVEQFCKSFSKVLDEMMSKVQLADIELTDEEQLAQLDSFNQCQCQSQDSSQPFSAEDTVLSLFKKAAKDYPDNLAAVYKDKKFTYKELDELTDKIGSIIYSKIKDCGKSEPVVSILIPRNEYVFILPLAAMKAGCAYQPLDPSYPQERLNFMVKDADAALLIADAELRNIITEYEGEVALVDELETSANLPDYSQPLSAEATILTPSSLFILLYTSGSTGVPKGVMLEHQNLISFIRWYRRYYDLKPEHNVAAYASFGFDANMMDLYPALTTGATVHVIAEDIRLDLMALNDYFEQNNITHSFITTQVGVQFLLNTENHSLKHLSVGGEKLMSVDPAEGYLFHNAYGPTECTIFTTTMPVLKKEPNIPIGKPTDELKCYVMDKHLHRLPVGAAGELVIVGKQVGRGYLNRPDKTAEAFFTIDGERAYHSGDIVRYRYDGNIEFVGRKDGQVKIRGFRIELKEVEAVIRDYQGIADVTVQAFDDPNGGKFIAAYVVSESEIDIDALNAFILDQKPPYMVPAFTMQIEKIPLNVNQKVDKKALPKPQSQSQNQGQSQGQVSSAPLNALEKELKAIIASVVNTEDFTITDVLGFVGLTSISSIKLATLIYKKYGVQLDSRTLAKTGTLQSIENQILEKLLNPETTSQSQTQADSSTTVPEASASVQSPSQGQSQAPLTYPQTGVYLDCLKNPGTTLYNVPEKLTFPKSVTAEELRSAVELTVQNHQSFKFVFKEVNGEPCQIINQNSKIINATVPVSQLSESEMADFESKFVRPFDIAQGPLFRFEIVETESNLHLFLDIHHLITDGGSVDIVIKEICARLNGEEVEPEEYSYTQFADDQKAAEGTESYTASKEFFHSRLSLCEGASQIPSDVVVKSSNHQIAKSSNEAASLGISQHVVDMAPVELLAKRLGVTPMSLFLSAAYYTVSRFVNNKQVYLGTISNGRSNLRIYNTTGMFVNTLALSSEIKDQTVSEYIKETAQNFADTITHEQYPFAQISADYGFKPEIVFEYQVGVIADNEVRGEKVAIKELHLDLAKFKIKIAVQDGTDGGHNIVVGYDTSLYSPALADTLAESLCAVCEHFATQPEALVKNISIMSQAQKEAVEKLHTVGTAPLDYKLFYQPIEKFAETQPDKIALIATDRTLTYKEFNEEANRIAHALMARGVKKGDRVVVLLPRTSAVMLSIYGISKAGAAYIPCDPEYPADRISLIIEDSEAAYVITTEEHIAEHEGKAILVDELINYNSNFNLNLNPNLDYDVTSNPNVDVTPDDLVYLIYTSGSTGRPKGVMLRHEGICNYLQCHPANRHVYAMATEGSCYLSVTTLSFDMSLKEYGVALFNGLTLVLTDETQSNNPIELARLFKETGADIFNATPSRLLSYMELPEFCDALRQCKCVLSGGEAYSDKLLARLHELKPKHIFNTYGPTEITVSSNCAELTDTDHITIGEPLLNYTEFVVDTDGNELPVGIVGELYIGGVGVAKGYNNLEKQTKERFVDYKGIRCYRSGDYARWTADGKIVTLGRMDNQIKLRGLRIELGEVEAAICKVEGVKQTVVMVKKIDNVEHLTAYYTADRPIDIEDMKAQIGTTLTHYMVPTAYLQMDKFPLTPNGKTDVKHLPEPQLAKVGGDYVAPRNKMEEDFCALFGQILSLDKVSAADSFFELGGTSLTATGVMIGAKKLGYEVTYADVFSHPTARGLAKLVGGEDAEEQDDPEVTDYDYSKINALLEANNLESFRNGERLSLGDVLLTGANGYLGIHILHNLLENHLKKNPQYKVYCMVRHGKNGVSSEARLKNLLFYYFEKSYQDLFEKQIVVIDGDVTNAEAFEEVSKVSKVSGGSDVPLTVINCAAIVKHFSEGTEIEDINIGGLQNCVDFCLKTGARLIQTSTNSTGGQSVNGYPDPQTNYSEQVHFFGQSLTSKYTHSKFLAERIVLESIIEKGLVAKVVRLGNLAPRATDGEFQINFRSNSSMGRLHIYQMLGACSYTDAMSKMEFSPIDEVAEAVLLLATTPKECCVFHPFNNHMVLLGDIVREMASALGVTIDEVEDEDFNAKLNEAAQDAEKAKILQSMLAYKSSSKLKVSMFAKYNPYTIGVLARLGFHWNVTSWDYVKRFIDAIAALDFFEDKR